MRIVSIFCTIFSFQSFANPRYLKSAGIDISAQLKQETVPESESESRDKVIQYIRNYVGDSGVEIGIQREGRYEFISFSFQDRPFCLNRVKIVERKDGSFFLVGDLPDFKNLSYASLEAASLDQLRKRVSEYFNDKVGFREEFECLHIDSASLKAAILMKVRTQRGDFKVLADSREVFMSVPLAFDAPSFERPVQELALPIDEKASSTGSMLAYEEMPVRTPLKTFAEPVSGDGTLTNDFFVTAISSSSRSVIPRALVPDLNFNFDTQDPRFGEVSVFVHAMKARNFFLSLGYKEYLEGLIVLSIHELFDKSPNNASYNPSSLSPYNQTAMLFGDGDGVRYGNFGMDPDVVTHEFAHHVIFEHLYSNVEESAVLHEGLADFFSQTRRRTPCFAESIIIVSQDESPICLRNAKNSVTYNSEFYKKNEVHSKSLIVSGLLWAMREAFGTDPANKIVFNSLQYLSRNSGFKDFFVALLLSDQDQFKAAHACSILDMGKERGFSSFLSDIDCKNYATVVSGKENGETKKNPTSPSNKMKCGMISHNGVRYESWVFFLIPLLIFFLPRKKRY